MADYFQRLAPVLPFGEDRSYPLPNLALNIWLRVSNKQQRKHLGRGKMGRALAIEKHISSGDVAVVSKNS